MTPRQRRRAARARVARVARSPLGRFLPNPRTWHCTFVCPKTGRAERLSLRHNRCSGCGKRWTAAAQRAALLGQLDGLDTTTADYGLALLDAQVRWFEAHPDEGVFLLAYGALLHAQVVAYVRSRLDGRPRTGFLEYVRVLRDAAQLRQVRRVLAGH